jgi:hypothetical protein
VLLGAKRSYVRWRLKCAIRTLGVDVTPDKTGNSRKCSQDETWEVVKYCRQAVMHLDPVNDGACDAHAVDRLTSALAAVRPRRK